MRKFGGFGSPIKGSGADCRPRAASGGAVVVRRPFAVPLLAVMITMVLAAIISSVAYADTTPQALPLNQNFSDISLITTNDDWSGVPGVIGYRGDNLAAEGADPRTVTADGSSTPVNVAANKTNPSAFNTGSLAEFHQTNQSPPKDLDPTVAFQWNVQADAPHLVMTFNTTGQSNIRVSYLLRDIDCGSNDALQPVALRYRVGNSGAYTNLPGGYVADATSGPNLDVLNTPVSASLPAATDNQPFVQVRVITVNSVTSEEWIGIDTLSVASSNPAIDLNGGASGTGYSATFAEDGGSVAIVNSTALTATDADSPTLSSATATITNLQDGATESLSADTTGTPITASYNPATGVLTLSGAGTPAQYQQVLRTVRYNNTSEPPGTTARSVNFVVSDGTYSSNTATSTVTVNPANDAPTLSATATNPTYTENGTPVDVYSGVSASTVESGQSIDRLTLNVSNVSGGASEILNIDGTDVALTNGNSVTTATNGMTVSVSVSGGTATVTITKSGGVSAAVAGNVIDGMTYRHAGDSPTAGNRAVTLTSIRDTGGTANGGSDTSTLNNVSTVTVNPVNDPPVLTLPGNPVSYTENAAPTVIDSGATVTDADSANFDTGTLTVDFTANGSADDRLTISEGNNITVAGNAVSYNGTQIGTFTGGSGTTPLVITFDSDATQAAVQTLAGRVAFSNVSDDPSTAQRTVRFQVTDPNDEPSETADARVNVVPVNDAPEITNVQYSSPATEGSPVTITVTATDFDTPTQLLVYSFDCDNDGVYETTNTPGDNTATCTFGDQGTYPVRVRVSDGDKTDEDTVQVQVGNADPAVSLTNPAPSVDEGDTVTYQFTASDAGDDTLAFTVDCGAGVQVGGITFENGSGSFRCRFLDGPANTTVSITADDGEGGTDQESASISISNVPPDYTAPNDQTVERGQAQDVSLGTFTDPGTDGSWEITVDWGDGNSETFTVPESARLPGGGFDLGDRSHTYADSGDYTVSVTVAETGGQPSDTGAFAVTAGNATPPVVDLNGADAGVDQGAPVTFTEGGDPVRVDLRNDLSVSDPDGQDLTQATARIVNAPDGTVERLAADTTGTGIVASYDPNTGVLTLTDPATLAQFQQVLRTVTYENASQNPTTDDRSIELVVNDGVLDSAPATATVTVAPPNATKADLNIRIDTPKTVTEGKPFPITFTVVNKGPDTAKNVVVKTVLPRGVKLVSAPDNCRYDRDTRTLACKLGNLAEGAKKALEIKIKAKDADDLELRATVDSDTSDPEAQNNREAEAIEVKAALKPEPKPESSGCRESGKGKTFFGTSGPDVMRGTPGDDTFFGFGGNDKIYGLGGEDSIIAGDGSDTIRGGDCSDSIDANDGNDFVYGEVGKDSLNGGDGNDRIHGGSGVDSFNGSGGTDRLYAKDGERESVNGGSERDRCVADKKDTIVNCP